MSPRQIKIPVGLTEEQFGEFIREEVRKVGGDPDTLYLESIDGISLDYEKEDYSRKQIFMKFNYDYFNNEETTIEEDLNDHGIAMRIIEDNNESILKTFNKWKNYIKEGVKNDK